MLSHEVFPVSGSGNSMLRTFILDSASPLTSYISSRNKACCLFSLSSGPTPWSRASWTLCLTIDLTSPWLYHSFLLYTLNTSTSTNLSKPKLHTVTPQAQLYRRVPSRSKSRTLSTLYKAPTACLTSSPATLLPRCRVPQHAGHPPPSTFHWPLPFCSPPVSHVTCSFLHSVLIHKSLSPWGFLSLHSLKCQYPLLPWTPTLHSPTSLFDSFS